MRKAAEMRESGDSAMVRRADVCRIIGCGYSTLTFWIKQGKFPAADKYVGATPYWKRTTVEAWMDEGTSSNKEARVTEAAA